MKRITIFYKDTFIQAEGNKQILLALEKAMKKPEEIDIIVIRDEDTIEIYTNPAYSSK